jgi:hypothetical protein
MLIFAELIPQDKLVLLICNMEGHQKGVCTTVAITEFGWMVLLHAPYSSYIVHQIFHLFVP